MRRHCTAHDWAPFWRCSRRIDHVGPCALHPAWWNLIGQIRVLGIRLSKGGR